MKRQSFKGIIDIIDNGAPPKIDDPENNKNKRKAEDGSGEARGGENNKAVKGQGKQNKKQNKGQPGQQISKKARKAAARAAAARQS